MDSRKRAATAVLLISLAVVAAVFMGCGDVFRPTINFEPSTNGTPAQTGQAIFLSTNPSGAGSDTHIDVSGDTSVGVVNVGANPVFLGKANASAFAINGNNTVTMYTALLPGTSAVTTIAIPASSSGSIGGATSSNGNTYIANSGSNDVSVIPIVGSVVTQTVPVGARPVMVATNSNGNKAYVINHDDNSVSVIGTQDNIVTSVIPVGSQPIWGVMSTDGIDVFVVNSGDGTVSVIDTTLDIVFTTINLNGTGISAALGSNFAFYDKTLERVYVTNPGDNSVTVIKADSINLGVTPQILPVFLAKIPVSGSPISVSALSDGTRAYAALGNCPAGTNHTNLLANLSGCTGGSVSEMDIVGLTEQTVIPVGAGAVSIATSDDATRAYSTNAIDQNVSIIETATESEILRMAAPQQSFGCANPNCGVSGVETPFMVVTFP